MRCPLGAHIRRSNPRNADLPPGPPGIVSWASARWASTPTALAHDLVASTRFHRLLRRGREYGAGVPLAQALAGAARRAPRPGCTSSASAPTSRASSSSCRTPGRWACNSTAWPSESDPLLGTRDCRPDGTPTDGFSMPRADGADERLAGLPQFVTVLGGAYFFLPGIRALRLPGHRAMNGP